MKITKSLFSLIFFSFAYVPNVFTSDDSNKKEMSPKERKKNEPTSSRKLSSVAEITALTVLGGALAHAAAASYDTEDNEETDIPLMKT